jgi:phosphotransferase system enzyme I (PtsP)
LAAAPSKSFDAGGTRMPPGGMAARRLLLRLRETMAGGAATLPELLRIVANELVAEVASVYAMRPGEILELTATHGLNPDAVGRTRLRVGEGIVGLVAATGTLLNLPDAQNHPGFVYRAETGEDAYLSMLAVPVLRAGRTLGVLTVQNRMPRLYEEAEVEVLQIVALLLAEVLAAAGARDGAEESLGSTLPRRFSGGSLAPGVALGRVVLLGGGPAAFRLLADDPGRELARLTGAVEAMRRGLDTLLEEQLPAIGGARGGKAAEEPLSASREVLETYRLLAADSGWIDRVAAAVRGGLTAEAAVSRVGGELRSRMRRITDPYLRERLADVEDLSSRLIAELTGGAPAEDATGAILLARRLGPAQLLDWHGRGIVGVAIEEGSPAGHAAILARALGLAALGGARGMIEAVETGDEAVLDADEGLLILRPDAELRTTYERALQARSARRAGWGKLARRPCVTTDGVELRLMINAGLPLELDQLDAVGAAGIGLFRTEIAMLARGSVADLPEQTAGYARVLDAAGDRPVIFRTLDLGGDKLLPDAPSSEEENPAMGWRSLRVGLDRPALLRRQLRALLLAAAGRRLSVMFPMVATVPEFRQARALLLAEAARVRPAPSVLEIGTMLEIPALLWQLPALLAEVDFISIGSNDLLQFMFAADRSSPALAARYDLLSAPVLDALDALAVACRAAGVPLSLCGEAASRPLEALTLAALGITTLSMPASALLAVKEVLVAADLGAFRGVLRAVRATAGREPSIREPLAAWAREQGLPV